MRAAMQHGRAGRAADHGSPLRLALIVWALAAVLLGCNPLDLRDRVLKRGAYHPPEPAELPTGGSDRPRFSILVDTAHGQLDGLPAWRVDDAESEPLPEDPRAPDDWDGQLSSLLWALHHTGRFRVAQLPPDRELSLGSCRDRAAWSHDLACHDLFITVEPNTAFTERETAALRGFVADGGGLLMAAEFYGSNRQGVPCNGDGEPTDLGPRPRRPAVAGDEVDSTGVLAALEGFTGLHPAGGPASPCVGGHPKGSEDHNNFIELGRTVRPPAGDPLLDGPFGRVERISFDRTTSFREADAHAATDLRPVLVRKRAEAPPRTAMIVATSGHGHGRIAAFGDASLFADGTASGESGPCRLRDPTRPDEDADILLLNTIAWLTPWTPTRPEPRLPFPDKSRCVTTR